MLILAVIGVIILVKIITAPFRWLFKLIFHVALGWGMLYLVNLFGGAFGISIAPSVANSAIAGIFGVPGVIGLIIYNLFF